MDDNHERYAVFGGPVSEAFVPSDKLLVIRIDDYSAMRHSAYISDMYEYIRGTPIAPCRFVCYLTGPTTLHEPGLCSFTSYYRITNFKYTHTFAPHSYRTIINKTAGASVAPTVPAPSFLDSGPVHSTAPHPPPCMILYSSPNCFLLPRAAARLQPSRQTPTKLFCEHARSFPCQLRLVPRSTTQVC